MFVTARILSLSISISLCINIYIYIYIYIYTYFVLVRLCIDMHSTKTEHCRSREPCNRTAYMSALRSVPEWRQGSHHPRTSPSSERTPRQDVERQEGELSTKDKQVELVICPSNGELGPNPLTTTGRPGVAGGV